MAKNYLFSFIKLELDNNEKLKNFKLKISEQHHHQEMLIYQLTSNLGSKLAKIDQQELTLAEHHVTLFEKTKEDHPSPYHYTAKLKDQLGKCYNLHVYFDKKDSILERPHLVEDGEQGKNVYPELAFTLGQLAIDNTHMLITDIRSLQERKLKENFDLYKKLEDELTHASVSLIISPDKYLVALNLVINHVKMMCNYQNFTQLLKLFNRINTALNSSSEAEHVEVSEMSSDEDEQPPQLLQEESIENKTPKIQSIENLVNDAVMLQESYSQKKQNADQDMAVDHFVSLHSKVYEALFLSENPTIECKKHILVRVQSLVTFVNFEGKKLLENLLFKDKFEVAIKLKNLVNTLPVSMLKLALLKNKADLLNFLLTHGNFALNTTAILDGISPVLYCYLNHTDTASRADCLSVLLKHGASVMIKHEGLPLCFYILEKKDVLKKALADNSEQTLANPAFYRYLVKNLELYLLRPTNPNNVAQVKDAISKYQNGIAVLPQIAELGRAKIIMQAEKIVADTTSHLDKAAIEQAADDPAVKALSKQYNEALIRFLNLFSPQQKRSMLIQSRQSSDNLFNFLKDKTPPREWKDGLINTYLFGTELIELQIKIHELCTIKKAKNNSRKLKQLSGQEQQLFEQLKKLHETYAPYLQIYKFISDNTLLNDLVDPTDLIAKIEIVIGSIKQSQDVLKHFMQYPNSMVTEAEVEGLNKILEKWVVTKAHNSGRFINKNELETLQDFHQSISKTAIIVSSLTAKLGGLTLMHNFTEVVDAISPRKGP
jgi:hypothetical protein